MKTLTTVEFLAPAYIIIGGNKTGQGAIITRDRKSTADVKMLEENIWLKFFFLNPSYLFLCCIFLAG